MQGRETKWPDEAVRGVGRGDLNQQRVFYFISWK